MERDPVRLVARRAGAGRRRSRCWSAATRPNSADYRQAVVDRLPLLLGLILVVTFVMLFLMTGSLLIPLKATVLNLLSLSVMFGALVWVYQDGNLSGLLGFTPTGTLDPSIPILMFCIAYGLSMDYEVFLLSRIKEEYDRTGDTRPPSRPGSSAARR